MRGQQAVVAMRSVGATPVCVWIDDTGPLTEISSPSQGWQRDTNHAHVEVEPGENPRCLDLRFTVGLTVHVHTMSDKRMQAIEATALACGAKRVLGCVFAGEGERMAVVSMTDTLGQFVWSADDATAS